jgi:crotonobetainyl-CoA:carnitine CoA-transferase CaiB-like acyl-CoA transferase
LDAGALDGVRVVEMGFWVAGPSAATILADWGAEVVKIEPPTGDPMRGLQASPAFDLDNRGKRAVALDLAKAEAREIALRMIDRADVFVSNIRPEILEGWGLDYDSLSKRHPRLVYAGITGYGLAGEDRNRPGYDYGAFWARSGIANAITPDGALHPPIQRGGMGDHMTGMATAGGVAAALYARDRTGRGQMVSASLLRTAIFMLGIDLNTALRLDPAQWGNLPRGRGGGRSAAFNPLFCCYRDSEGRWFWLLALQGDRHWPDIARAVGHPEWLTDERFSSIMVRGRHSAELMALLDEVLATRTVAEWGRVFDAHDVWWAPVQTTLEVIADPQAHAAGAFVEMPAADGTVIRQVATPIDFSDTASKPRGPTPELGQHTEDVLLELGYDWEDIVRLKTEGAIP